MNIIKNIFKSILITIGGIVTIFLTYIIIYALINSLIKIFINFDLYYCFVVVSGIGVYLLIIGIILYSVYLFLNWILTLIEKKIK